MYTADIKQWAVALWRRCWTGPERVQPVVTGAGTGDDDKAASKNSDDDSEVVVESAFGAIPAVVKATDRIKRGVIAMHHSWGAAPDRNASVREVGSNTNLLVSSETQLQAFTGMPKASGIPVRIRP